MKKINKSPSITVLMPVYNGESYLRESISSILTQTFHDFELLIIDDCSADSSVNIIKAYDDKRIRLVVNSTNLGLVGALNKGIKLSSGKYIARMDQDDISLPDRLERQFDFMEKNPLVGICGGAIKLIGGNRGVLYRPIKDEQIRTQLLFGTAFFHPTTMFRSALFKKNNLRYDPSFKYMEDYEFWTRCAKHFLLANLSDTLLLYRTHISQMSQRYHHTQVFLTKKVHHRLLSKLGIKVSDEMLELHWSISSKKFKPSTEILKKMSVWLLQLSVANKKTKQYSHVELEKTIYKRWFELCRASSSLGMKTWLEFWKFAPRQKIPSVPGFVFFTLECFKSSLVQIV